MRKKEKIEAGKRELLVFLYKWEFLRRNTDFIKDFKPIDEFFGNVKIDRKKIKKIVNSSYKNKTPPFEQMQQWEKIFGDHRQWEKALTRYLELLKKWEMPVLFSPSFGIENIDELVIDDPEKWVTNLGETIFIDKFEYFFFLLMGFLQSAQKTSLGDNAILPAFIILPHLMNKKKTNQNILNVSINLKYPKPMILATVEFFIDSAKRSQPKKKNTRARLEEYLNYLAIYDLRESGIGWRKIAKKVYPKEIFPENTKRKVMIGYNKCLDLINSGYKDLI
ncbi:MAG: hypothetical protein K9L87_01375 [Candidatus Omnitrophica bacterium]|nr:hypothetical protein [Candidatus Omnitrophota bacterium]MCF7897395.1 hypothetical protein [Candidatus Omnitrophota bacterium]MCF7909498.1 hypothetical protein [Candidatus Omnitrophota bacterium]